MSQKSNLTAESQFVWFLCCWFVCFLPNSLNGKHFSTHGKDYDLLIMTAACFQEMSIHTHICVKLLFPAQTMFSVPSNWTHMLCIITCLVPYHGSSQLALWVEGQTGAETNKAGRHLWHLDSSPVGFWNWTGRCLTFGTARTLTEALSQTFPLFFFLQGCSSYFSQCTQEFMNDKTSLKRPPSLSLSLSFQLSRAIKSKLMTVCHFSAVTIRIKYIRQHAWKWRAAHVEETERPDSSKRLDRADRKCPVSKDKVNHQTELQTGSQHQPTDDHRPRMVASHYNRELLILSQRLSKDDDDKDHTQQHNMGKNSHFALQGSFHCWEI